MNTRHRTVAGLLTVIAALLALNLILKGPAPAQASDMRSPEASTPTVVSLDVKTNAFEGGQNWVLHRLWSDGAVDRISYLSNEPPWCGLLNVTCVVPGTCMADVDRSGNVATSDLLQVLGDWGECN